MKHLEVAAAVILNNDKYLCMQRNQSKFDYISYKFEFPGGKLEEGEDEITALKREISEELNIDINILNKITTVEHTYPDFSLNMHCYLCTTDVSLITLKDHISYLWLEKDLLHTLDWAAADIPVLKHL